MFLCSLSQPISRILLSRLLGTDDHLSGIPISRNLKRASKRYALAPDRCFPRRPSPGSPALALTPNRGLRLSGLDRYFDLPRFQPYPPKFCLAKLGRAVCFLLHFPWPQTNAPNNSEQIANNQSYLLYVICYTARLFLYPSPLATITLPNCFGVVFGLSSRPTFWIFPFVPLSQLIFQHYVLQNVCVNLQ